jgi:hypothetical protein
MDDDELEQQQREQVGGAGPWDERRIDPGYEIDDAK